MTEQELKTRAADLKRHDQNMRWATYLLFVWIALLTAWVLWGHAS